MALFKQIKTDIRGTLKSIPTRIENGFRKIVGPSTPEPETITFKNKDGKQFTLKKQNTIYRVKNPRRVV